MFAWAVRAAQAYCDRWQIETSFLTVKQEFALGKARAGTGELGPHEEPRLDRANRCFRKSRLVFEAPQNISRPVFSGVS